MKKKIDLPIRSDDIYLEIENFQDYELTNCIAYEMAIRNDEVKSLLLSNTDKLYTIDEVLDRVFNDKPDLLKDVFLMSAFEYNIYNLYKSENLNNENYKTFYLKYKRERKKEYLIQAGDAFFVESSIHILSNGKKRGHQRISKKYSRPEMKQNFYNNFRFDLNLSLPKEELIAYISQIKDEYDRDNSIIKSPLELLGEKLNIKTIKFKEMTSKEWADCFFIYDYFKVSTDKLKGTKFQKLQELLTEYNGIKIEKTKEELRKSKNRNDNSKYKIVSFKVYNELRDNYVHKKIKPFYSLATIEDRLKLMTLLIDDLGYKTLIL